MAAALSRGWRDMSEATLLVASFALLILLGTAGLLLVPGLQHAPPLRLVDALFTMTSAVCVTGLSVVDTATHFTFAGQLWLLAFIQLGGLGLLTITTAIIGMLGRRVSLRSEVIAAPGFQTSHGRELTGIVGRVIVYTLAVEAAGALLLWLAWLPRFDAAGAAWHAVFQAVSAFCNAGFSTFSDSLEGSAHQPFALLVLSGLVVLGGFGYLASGELLRWARKVAAGRRARLSAHTFAALLTTAALLVLGFLAFAALEWEGALAHLSPADRLANAWVMSVMPRTAGFNTVHYGEVGNDTAYLTIALMLIGGSPGSTAGGVKTTALAVLAALALARIRGKPYVGLHGRAVPDDTVQRTVALTVLAFLLVSLAVFVLSLTETQHQTVEAARRAFLPLFFEAVSAFGTVGLSMGVTPELTDAGKLTVIALMFLGRVGPLSFFAAVAVRGTTQPRGLRPAHDDVIVG